MPGIELVYFDGCPNLSEARLRIAEALTRTAMPQHWTEWNIDDPTTPDDRRGYGSPTVLIDGRDVAGGESGAGRGCVAAGAPSVARLVAALGAASSADA